MTEFVESECLEPLAWYFVALDTSPPRRRGYE